LSEENTLFESLDNKLIDFPELKRMLKDLLLRGRVIEYVPGDMGMRMALMYGFVILENGIAAVSNRIFETRLYNGFLAEQARCIDISQIAADENNQFLTDGRLDMDLVIHKFAAHYTELFGEENEKFLEDNGRCIFLLYLKPIINGTGNYYIEARTRTNRRTDVIIDFKGQQQGVELKKFYKELLEHLGERCTGRVREIYQGAQSNIDEPKNLEKIIQTIDQFDWYTAKEEVLGNLYEGLLEKNANEKKSGAGQYFTPRVLINVMTRLIAPQPGERCNDPACGTFGFMIAADRYVKDHTDELFELSVDQQEFQRTQAFSGCELVHDTHSLALMNAMLHNMEGEITLGDTLSNIGKSMKDYDVVLTNPPFGTKKGG